MVHLRWLTGGFMRALDLILPRATVLTVTSPQSFQHRPPSTAASNFGTLTAVIFLRDAGAFPVKSRQEF